MPRYSARETQGMAIDGDVTGRLTRAAPGRTKRLGPVLPLGGWETGPERNRDMRNVTDENDSGKREVSSPTCATCRFWGEPVLAIRRNVPGVGDVHGMDTGLRNCEAVPFYGEDSAGMPANETTLATVRDGEGHRGELLTRAAFGCAMWEPGDAPVPRAVLKKVAEALSGIPGPSQGYCERFGTHVTEEQDRDSGEALTFDEAKKRLAELGLSKLYVDTLLMRPEAFSGNSPPFTIADEALWQKTVAVLAAHSRHPGRVATTASLRVADRLLDFAVVMRAAMSGDAAAIAKARALHDEVLPLLSEDDPRRASLETLRAKLEAT